MKKFLALVITFTIVIGISLCGCNQTVTDSSSVSNEEMNYDTEFDKIMESIDDMNVNSEYICDLILTMWQSVDTDTLTGCIYTLKNLKSTDDDEFYSSSGPNPMNVATALDLHKLSPSYDSPKVRSAIYDYAVKFQEATKNVSEAKNDLKEQIKTIKDTMGNEHENGIKALQDYYIKSSTLADFALEPSGSLITYSNSYKEIKDNITEAKNTADLAK